MRAAKVKSVTLFDSAKTFSTRPFYKVGILLINAWKLTLIWILCRPGRIILTSQRSQSVCIINIIPLVLVVDISYYTHKYRVFRYKYRVFRYKYRVFRYKYRVFRYKYRMFRYKYRVFRYKYRVFRYKYRVFRYKYRVFRYKYRLFRYKYRVFRE